jgi:hypothetical protein
MPVVDAPPPTPDGFGKHVKGDEFLKRPLTETEIEVLVDCLIRDATPE